MNITRGPIRSAKKVGIYGPEGVGKTTFAARFPGAVFIDTEGSTRHMDVARFEPPEELSMVADQINYVISNPKEFGTLVIDTVDWLEKLLFNAVCTENHWKNIEEPGYGKGYVAARQKMQQLLEMLDMVIKRGVNVVLVCHSFIRKFEQPDEMSSYDRYVLKLNEKNISPLIKEWVDMLLFVNYKTDVVAVEGSKTKKAKGGQKRIMYTTHTAAWDAKNRFGLPDEMPFEYERIAHLFGDSEPAEVAAPAEVKAAPAPAKKDAAEKAEIVTRIPSKKPKMQRPESMRSEDLEKDGLLETLWGLMDKACIIDPLLIQSVVAEKEYYDAATLIRDYDKDFIEGVLIEAWDQVNALAQDKMNSLPF